MHVILKGSSLCWRQFIESWEMLVFVHRGPSVIWALPSLGCPRQQLTHYMLTILAKLTSNPGARKARSVLQTGWPSVGTVSSSCGAQRWHQQPCCPPQRQPRVSIFWLLKVFLLLPCSLGLKTTRFNELNATKNFLSNSSSTNVTYLVRSQPFGICPSRIMKSKRALIDPWHHLSPRVLYLENKNSQSQVKFE